MSTMSERIANLTPGQRALLERRMRAAAPRPQGSQPIAIVGMGCRLPGGVADPESYWRLLVEGIDAISEVPADRWDNARLHDSDPDRPGRISSRWGGFVRDVDRFDAAYFGISPREAVRMDPQQRMLLEVAVDALEDAGIATDRLAGSDTGVFVGAHGHASDYLWLQYTDPESMDAFAGTGTAHNLFAGRLSYVFDLHGPAVVVDTACSSSLAAVHLAVQSLRSGESSLALAGGVNLILGPHFSIAASRMHMLAPDGRCKAFDQRADGFVRSEGCGLVVLKRLADAIADGDPIRAVIRGSAMNQDGHTNGITAPSGIAQRAVIERALRDAGVEGGAIGYVEAHGTGTALGDPIEIEALAAIIGRSGAGAQPCWVGSVKTNIGHLEGAAGVAGLIKAALVLQHREIPRNLHFTGLNPHISIAGTRIEFPTRQQSWAQVPGARLAAVSSFGWSGTNTHVVLEEPPAPAAGAVVASNGVDALLLPLSARSPAALQQLMCRHQARIPMVEPEGLRGMCRTAALHRTHHDHRVAVVAADRDGLLAALDHAVAGASGRRSVEGPRTVFVFPGQGSQWLGMGRTLMQSEPVFRTALERCDAAIRAEGGWSVLEELRREQGNPDIGVLQPTLFAVQVALAALWRSWGVEPEAVVGHSMGEVAAAHVAGMLDLEAATCVICRRSALLRRVAGRGAMALVELPLAEARDACGEHADRVAVAVANGPRASVLSGDPLALDDIIARLGARGVFCRLIKVDVASHSPQVDELRDDLLAALAGIEPRDGEVPLYSTVAAEVRNGRELGPDYWVRNLRDPVRFHDAMQLLLASKFDVFLEISPHPILVPPIEDAIADAGADAIAVASLRRDQPERMQLLQGLARLYERGAGIDWARIWPERSRVTALPGYPWQRERYWLDDLQPSSDFSWRSGSTGGPGDVNEDTRAWLFVPEWRRRPADGRAPAPEVGAWVVFADTAGRGVEIAATLAREGCDAWTVVRGEAFAAQGDRSFSVRAGEREDYAKLLVAVGGTGQRLAGIVHCWNVDAPSNDADVESLQDFQVTGCASVAFLIQALVAHDLPRPPRIRIVTQGAHSPDGRATTLAQTPAWGLGRVISEEHPEFWGGLIDLDPQASGAAAAEFVLRELGTEDVEDGIAQAGGERHVLRLAPFVARPGPDVQCDPTASYLVTGGLGAVGLETARWLVERGARRIVLAGRNALPPRERWDAPESASSMDRIRGVRRLEAMGVIVELASLDAADAAAVRDFLAARTAAGLPPLRGIVHAAADTGDCLVVELDVTKLMKVLRPKLVGASVIERCTRDIPLDFFVLHSSLGSLVGQPGHPSYAAANAFLDGLAVDARQRGRRALAVNWAAWADLGLAQTEGGRRTIGELERRGIRSFRAAAGTQALGQLLAGEAITAVVAPADWRRFVEASRKTRVPSIARDIGLYEPQQAAVGAPKMRAALEALSPEQRPVQLRQRLQTELAEVLRLPVERIDTEVPMGQLGLESLTALELRKRLEAALGLRLSATVMWNYPTVTRLAEYLLGRLDSSAGEAAPPTSAVTARGTAQGGVVSRAATDEMSEEDAILALLGRDGGGS